MKTMSDFVTIGNPVFCLFLFLTSVHFRGELQYVGDVSEQKNEELTNKFLKFLSDKIFVATLRNFRHFCPTKNIAQYFFSIFEISN